MQASPYQNMSFNRQPMYTPQYNYNPYFQQQMPQQLMEQPQFRQQMPMGISGGVVQSVEMITANDVPMDGSMAFFPLQDMSAILAKSWNADGTIKTVVYAPRQDCGQGQSDPSVQAIGLSDEAMTTFMRRFDELSERLCSIEQSMPRANKQVSTKKKEE